VIRAWNRWVDVCWEQEHGRSLALFRIGLGSLLTFVLFRMLVSGPIDPLYAPVSRGGLALATKLYLLPEAPSAALVQGLFGAALLSAITLAGGVFGRIGGRLNAFVLLQLLLAIHSIPTGVGGAYDWLFHNALWFLVLGDGTATLSLHCRRTGAWTSDRLVPAFPRYLAVFQLVLLYTGAVAAKHSHGWSAPYEALYYSLRRTNYSRIEMPWLGDIFFFTQVGTALSWWFEATFWLVGVWFLARRGLLGERARGWSRLDVRLPYLFVGFGMHVLILLAMDVGPFSAVTFVYYLALIEPDDRLAPLRRLIPRLRARAE
jgi:hypothetical protein